MVSRIGERRHFAEIQSSAKSKDEEGGTIRTWSKDNDWWIKITVMGGKEREEARQTKSKLTHRITMRFYEDGLTPEMRIVFDGKFFNIIAVVDPGYRGCDTIVDCQIDLEQVA